MAGRALLVAGGGSGPVGVAGGRGRSYIWMVTFLLAGGPGEDVFVGRAAELAGLADVLARVRGGQPWLVCIEGESGVGKTALARRALATAGLATRWARGDPAEADLEYGIVGQLAAGAGRAALARYPLLAGDVVRASPFAVGAQLLGLIGEVLGAGPVALVIDDVQWADPRSVQALSFTFRRLSVDAVAVIAIVRGDRDQLDAPVRQLLLSVERRHRIVVGGLAVADVAALAAGLGGGPLGADATRRLHERTGGHTLYLRTVLADPEGAGRLAGREAGVVPASLAAAIGDQLAALPGPARSLLELLAVVDGPVPLARLGRAAGVASPAAAIEPAVRAGLADVAAAEPARPVVLRHALQREAIYASLAPGRRRELHARAVTVADEARGWAHRVAALDDPDEGLAGELEQLAAREADAGRLALAATHLQWAADISPDRPGRERRLLTAALHLMLAEGARGLALRPAVEAATPSPLRDCVLGTMARLDGRMREAERRLSQALARAQADPGSRPLAAVIASGLANIYAVLGEGEKVQAFGRWALGTGCLDAAAASLTRTLIAIGVSQAAGPRAALAELAHLDADPARVEPVDVDGLAFRGWFRLLVGDLGPAVADLAASLKLVRRGAALGVRRAYFYLALAQYLAGAWDDVLLTAEQGFSAAAINPRYYDLPLLHLAAGFVPAGRGQTEEAERHAAVAEQVAASLDYGQERLPAAMARALVCQAAGDYLGMAGALGPWQDDAALDSRSRLYGVLWRPLLAEGLLGSGQADQAAAVAARLRAESGQVSYLAPALAWLEGWLAELRGAPQEALRAYQAGEEDAASTGSPVYTARLLLAHGRLLRRTGNRKDAAGRLRRAHALFAGLRAAPFLARAEQELAACGLRQERATARPVLAMTDRETEVARLIERGMTNAEIAAELFITPKAVEYHLGNIYAKFGVTGRHQLRRLLGDSRHPAPA
jgi:DNA-binding CsgD family transcriptional regulator